MSEAVDASALAFLLSVVGDEGAGGAGEERGGGEEGSKRVEAAAQAGQGRVVGLAGPPQPLSSPGDEVEGAV